MHWVAPLIVSKHLFMFPRKRHKGITTHYVIKLAGEPYMTLLRPPSYQGGDVAAEMEERGGFGTAKSVELTLNENLSQRAIESHVISRRRHQWYARYERLVARHIRPND